MRFFWLLIMVGIFSFCTSCTDDPVSLDLVFQLQYEDEPLVMLDEYQFPSGEIIKFTRFSFFISDVEIQTTEGTSDILDVDLLRFSESHSSSADAEVGMTYTLENVPANAKEALQFTIGVNPELNAKVPADYESDHPLANSGEYWIAWDSYIFLKIEGIVDLDGDGETETNMALHIGSDMAARDVRLSITDTESITIPIDVKSIFEESNVIFDIQNNPQIHSLSQLDLAEFLMDNLTKTIQL